MSTLGTLSAYAIALYYLVIIFSFINSCLIKINEHHLYEGRKVPLNKVRTLYRLQSTVSSLYKYILFQNLGNSSSGAT